MNNVLVSQEAIKIILNRKKHSKDDIAWAETELEAALTRKNKLKTICSSHWLFDLFIDSSQNFPSEECLIHDDNPGEKSIVMYGSNLYWCLVIDDRFDSEQTLCRCIPYTWNSEKEGLGKGFGWLLPDRSDFYKNVLGPSNLDGRYVIGYRKCDKNDPVEQILNRFREFHDKQLTSCQ